MPFPYVMYVNYILTQPDASEAVIFHHTVIKVITPPLKNLTHWLLRAKTRRMDKYDENLYVARLIGEGREIMSWRAEHVCRAMAAGATIERAAEMIGCSLEDARRVINHPTIKQRIKQLMSMPDAQDIVEITDLSEQEWRLGLLRKANQFAAIGQPRLELDAYRAYGQAMKYDEIALNNTKVAKMSRAEILEVMRKQADELELLGDDD